MTEAEAVEVAYRAVGPGAQPTAHLRWMPTQESAGSAQTEMVLCQLWKGPLGVIWLAVPDFVPEDARSDDKRPDKQAPPAEIVTPLTNWHLCHGCAPAGNGDHYHGTVEEYGSEVRMMVVPLRAPDKDGNFVCGGRRFRLDPP